MPVAFYIVPMKRNPFPAGPFPQRDIALVIDDPNFKNWAGIEVMGNRAIVKVNAGAARLTQYDAAYKRLPKNSLDTSLSDLSAPVKAALRAEVLGMGYTAAEVNARFPNGVGEYTLRQFLQFVSSRRRRERYDPDADEIILDGQDDPCGSLDEIDQQVR